MRASSRDMLAPVPPAIGFEEQLEVALAGVRSSVLAAHSQQLAAAWQDQHIGGNVEILKCASRTCNSPRGCATLGQPIRSRSSLWNLGPAVSKPPIHFEPEFGGLEETFFEWTTEKTNPPQPLPKTARDDDKMQQTPCQQATGTSAAPSDATRPGWLQAVDKSTSRLSRITAGALSIGAQTIKSATDSPFTSTGTDDDLPIESRDRLLSAIKKANCGRATKHEHRRAADLIRCKNLDGISACVIVLNIISMGISVDVYPESSFWIVVDSCFACFFFIEIALKFTHLRCASFFCGHEARWNIFEFVLVALAVTEIIAASTAFGPKDAAESAGMLALLRVLRLARIARLARLARLQFFGDLIMILNGALGGVRTLVWSMFLIAIPVYALALIMRESLGVDEENFGNLLLSINTVFRCTVAGECTNLEGRPIFLMATKEHGWMYGAIYSISVLLMTFGLFNVIVAIYVENTLAAAKYNDVTQKRQRLMDEHMFAEKAVELVEFIWRHATRSDREAIEMPPDLDEATSIEITPSFFEELRSHKQFQDILRGLDIADEDQLDLFDTLDVDGGGTIDVDELVCGIAKLRGDARRSDIVGVNLMMRSMQQDLSELGEAVGALHQCINNLTNIPPQNGERVQSTSSHNGMKRKSISGISAKKRRSIIPASAS